MDAAALRTIAVHIPTEELTERLLDVAGPLASACHARIVGVHALPSVVVYADVTVPVSAEFIMAQQESFQKTAKAIGERFRARASFLGLESEWRAPESDAGAPMPMAIDACRTADLVVASQWDDSIPASSGYSPADLVMAVGRPVLLVPTAGRFGEVGRNVVVTWNGSRESARAAFDALPLLQDNAQVHLLSVGDDGAESAQAMADALARHGLSVEVATAHGSEIPPADEILSRSADLGADLIVMGCYGHSRMRETVFGGVTSSMLRQMTAPVLMSH
ncbi:universal stress protein [Propylenella binzhouense]|uniref:Universal stress protein n=1 Tax=Propylenella binzhouense TaxID=2555902 RepID=A0A964T325_9HYPH|nr:universal stress protein [Propylenella binzhouense]MYZ47042.1 universal stress protein [Propylenella binzhouense]